MQGIQGPLILMRGCWYMTLSDTIILKGITYYRRDIKGF